MKKLQISDAEVMGIAIRQEIERSEEVRYDHRLHGLLLVANGMSARQAALWLDESDRTVQRWVNRFEQIGFAGLHEGERPGRPSLLGTEQWQSLETDLQGSPREFGDELARVHRFPPDKVRKGAQSGVSRSSRLHLDMP